MKVDDEVYLTLLHDNVLQSEDTIRIINSNKSMIKLKVKFLLSPKFFADYKLYNMISRVVTLLCIVSLLIVNTAIACDSEDPMCFVSASQNALHQIHRMDENTITENPREPAGTINSPG